MANRAAAGQYRCSAERSPVCPVAPCWATQGSSAGLRRGDCPQSSRAGPVHRLPSTVSSAFVLGALASTLCSSLSPLRSEHIREAAAEALEGGRTQGQGTKAKGIEVADVGKVERVAPEGRAAGFLNEEQQGIEP